MAKIYLGNAFSLQMLDTSVTNIVNVIPASVGEIAGSDFMSVIGHA